MTWKEGAGERIGQMISTEQEEPMMVMGYVLVAELVDANGDKRVTFNCPPDQRSTTTLGLLAYADTVERANVSRDWFSDD